MTAVVLLASLLLPLAPDARASTAAVGLAPAATGSWLVDAAGRVTAVAGAASLGSVTTPLRSPIVGIASTPTGRGYWLVASDGGIFTFGDAAFLGSTGAIRLAKPIVGMTSTPTGRGYWLVASDGGIFTFGDARFFGSTGAIRLAKPIVGMASTPTGRGYWMVASDGGIFTFGDAVFQGSTGAMPLTSPIVGMARTGTGRGYWLVGGDGGVFTFGDAVYAGRAAGAVRGVTAASGGYRVATSDGVVSSFVAGAAPVTTYGATREAWRWPFASTSPWNMPIGSSAQYERASAPRTASLIDDSIDTWVNAERYSLPVYRARETDPMATFRRTGRPDVQLRVPNDARPGEGSDAQLAVVQPDGRRMYESWKTAGANPSWTTGYLVETDLHGPGVGEGGVRAYGGSALGGLIRAWELEEGRIRHAVALVLTNEQLGRGPVWPATNEDGNASSTYSGVIPMGTLAAIPPSVDLDHLGLSREGLALARAMRDHGAYVVDRSSAFLVETDPSLAGTTALANLRRDLRAIRPHLRVVTNNGPLSVGGGGAPRAPLAPPLALP